MTIFDSKSRSLRTFKIRLYCYDIILYTYMYIYICKMYYIMRYLKKIAQISLNLIFDLKIILKKSHLLKIFVKYSSKILSFRNLWKDPRSRIFNSSQAKILTEKNHQLTLKMPILGNRGSPIESCRSNSFKFCRPKNPY